MGLTVPILSYPRSGVTFLRHVLEQLYGVTTRTVYNEPLNAMGNLFPGNRKWNPEEADIYSGPVIFLKTHETKATEHEGPAIHLVRDGRDALCSHAQYDMRWGTARDMPDVPYEHVLEQLVRGTWPRAGEPLEGFEGIWNWSAHTKAALERTEPTALIRFDDLIADPFAIVRGAVAELSLPLRELENGVVWDFSTLHKRDPHFFPKGKTGRWREDMPGRIQELFWDNHGEMMSALGYVRELVSV